MDGQTSVDCHDFTCSALEVSGFPCPDADANQVAKGKPLLLISCISIVKSSLFKLPPGPVMSTAPGSASWSGVAEELCLLAGEVPLSLCVAAQLSEECRDCVD